MKKRFFLALTSFSLSLLCYGQDEGVDQFVFDNEGRTYSTSDPVRITYDLENFEILHSNFGGCGGGAVYSVIRHSPDSLLIQSPKPSCCYLLMEYAYSEVGSLEIVIGSPGIYSVVFIVKKQDQKEVIEDRFTQTLSTPKFEIIDKKEN
jgi:hypothetical protein